MAICNEADTRERIAPNSMGEKMSWRRKRCQTDGAWMKVIPVLLLDILEPLVKGHLKTPFPIFGGLSIFFPLFRYFGNL